MTKTSDKPVYSIDVRVYYEDTDFGGVVYYANYLKFMERARTEFLRSLGFNQSQLFGDHRRMFVVRSADLGFVSPARFDDVLSVTAEVACVRRASMEFVQRCTLVRSTSSDVSGVSSSDLVATGKILIACLDADSFKPCAIPGALKMVLDS